MKHKLLFACTFLIFSFSKATAYLTSVEVEQIVDCEIAGEVNIKGVLPSSNYQIDSIVINDLLVVPDPGTFTPLGNNYVVYVSKIEGGVGLLETVPFDTTLIMLHDELVVYPFSNSSIGAIYVLDGEYKEQISGSSFWYTKPAGCTSISPESVTSCDSINVTVSHRYDVCSGYEYLGSETEIKNDTIFIRKTYRLPENPLVCFDYWGPSYVSTKIEPLPEGKYTVASVFDVINSVFNGETYYSEVEVLQGTCPVTGFDEEIEVSLFYPSLVETVITVSETVLNSSIYSLSGKLMFTSSEKEIDASGLNEGVYIIELTSENSITRKQFVKQ